MQTIFDSEKFAARKRFQVYVEAVCEQYLPVECRKLGDSPFKAHLEATEIGGMPITRSSVSGQSTELTPNRIQSQNKHDKLWAFIVLSGSTITNHYERSATTQAGDLMIFDPSKTGTCDYPDPTSLLAIELPRVPLESALGAASSYAGLIVGGSLPETFLIRSYFNDLIGLSGQLTPDIAERMAGIGTDLIVAGLAARLAQETPRALQDTVTVQRAKAYVTTHLSDPTLDPAQIAAAVGVPLPHLQRLFHERGRDLSDWLWQRRLAVAARMLADPRQTDLSIAALAQGCGFLNPTRFARQFRDRFDVPPSEYRRAARQSRA